jgi:hypothetical protein
MISPTLSGKRDPTQFFEKLVGRPGLELADGSDMWSRPGIAGHRPLAGGGESPRPQGASNPGPPD